MAKTALVKTETPGSPAKFYEWVPLVSFEEFCRDAEANKWTGQGWQVQYRRADYFLPGWDCKFAQKADALKAAYDELQFLAEHAGDVNIRRVFLKKESHHEIFRKGGNHVTISTARSRVTDLWHFGEHYVLADRGCASPCIVSRNGFPSEAEALFIACGEILESMLTELRRGDEILQKAPFTQARAALAERIGELIRESPELLEYN